MIVENYFENQALYPVLRVVNNTSSTQTVNVSASYDGKTLRWEEANIDPSNSLKFYSSSSCVTGAHTIVWYIDDIAVTSTSYTIN